RVVARAFLPRSIPLSGICVKLWTPHPPMVATDPVIHRHKTAIRRPSLSLPVKCLLRDGLFDASKRLFDYGCGHGRDIALLRDMGIGCDGWDPAHRAEVERERAEVVNLGYVINVIEDPEERVQALRS